jgi:hypothetical protein
MDSAILAFLEEGTEVVMLTGVETADGLTWQQVEVNEQIGWVSIQLLEQN